MAVRQAAQLGGDHRVGPATQRGQRRCHVEPAQPGEERLHLAGHDRLDGGPVGVEAAFVAQCFAEPFQVDEAHAG